MNTNLYIGNISYDATEETLKEHFSQCGEVKSVKIIKDHETGRSKGFGFVEMQDYKGAQSAVDDLDQGTFLGRQLRVNEAKPREKKPFRDNDRRDNDRRNNYRG